LHIGVAWPAHRYKTASGKIVNNWCSTTTKYWWLTKAPNMDDYELA